MATPMPSEADLYKIFSAADRDKSGHISADELQKALSNGTWEPFNLRLVKMMIGMFDRDGNQTIDYNEFKQLWKFINDWLNCFRQFDADRSGSIGKQELNHALNSFGYRLSDATYNLFMKKFGTPDGQAIIFDNFLLLCISLQGATASFAAFDVERKGEIKISYEQFLNSVVPLIA